MEWEKDALRRRSEIALAWFWVLGWIAVVQTFASDPFSAAETSRFITPLLRFLFPEADAAWIAHVHFLIRKASHFTEYAILALLALRAFRLNFERPLAWLAAASLALVLVSAVVDETRQASIASRTGAFSDVVLDFTGAATALTVASVAHWLWGRRK